MSISSLEELERLRPRPGPAVTGAKYDSRRITPGDVFFALPGKHAHGIQFADEALARGATFVISDQPHPTGTVVSDPATYLLKLGQQSRNARTGAVIGVTGSVGKTTTKDLLAAAISAYASPGNRNTPLAHATELISMEATVRASQKYHGPKIGEVCKHIYSDCCAEMRAACGHLVLPQNISRPHRSEANGAAKALFAKFAK